MVCRDCGKIVVTQYNYTACIPCINKDEWKSISTMKKKVWMKELKEYREELYEDPERDARDKEEMVVDVEEMLERAKILRNIPTIVVGGL